jgi:hypothetical protein
MKKIVREISHLINRVTGKVAVHAKGSAIKGDYSAGRRDAFDNDYNGKFD